MKSALTILTALLLGPLVAAALEQRPLLPANCYGWHYDGQHAKRTFLHWTYPSSATSALAKQAQQPGEPAPNSVVRPLAGIYDSADPKVAEWHVRLAKAAGIDAFLVDWREHGDAGNQRNELL